jgi:hypothetical protein
MLPGTGRLRGRAVPGRRTAEPQRSRTRPRRPMPRQCREGGSSAIAERVLGRRGTPLRLRLPLWPFWRQTRACAGRPVRRSRGMRSAARQAPRWSSPERRPDLRMAQPRTSGAFAHDHDRPRSRAPEHRALTADAHGRCGHMRSCRNGLQRRHGPLRQLIGNRGLEPAAQGIRPLRSSRVSPRGTRRGDHRYRGHADQPRHASSVGNHADRSSAPFAPRDQATTVGRRRLPARCVIQCAPPTGMTGHSNCFTTPRSVAAPAANAALTSVPESSTPLPFRSPAASAAG